MLGENYVLVVLVVIDLVEISIFLLDVDFYGFEKINFKVIFVEVGI